jgi:predicted AlkP superfamily pyrophosphatase or phosphodiesterase
VRRLAVALALLVLSGLAALAAAAPRRHLVLISLDGLRPEFYQDDAYAAPELRRLARTGVAARAAEGVFPSVTYPNHAAIVTGVRPMRHGIAFNVLFEPTGERGRWYEEAADLRSPPLWEWARAGGLSTAAVSWPATVGAPIDLLVPERGYHHHPEPLDALRAAATPGLFERLGVTPKAEMFKDVVAWDEFLAETGAAMIRRARPHLLLIHFVQLDYFQHRGGRESAELRAALARVDGHVATLARALREAGIAERAAVIVTGDHGFQDVTATALPNAILSRAGLRACPRPGDGWRATAHISGGGAAAVFVSPPGDAGAAAAAEEALRRAANGAFSVLTRRELDDLGAMPGAALALEAAPGYAFSGSCGPALTQPSRGGTHGFLPSRPSMATGFIAAGAGVRRGVTVDRVRLIDVAPTAARLLGVTPPPVEGRVLDEALE